MVRGVEIAKLAVTFLGLSIVSVAGFTEPLRSPDQPLNANPELGTAVNATAVPELYQTLLGERDILPPVMGKTGDAEVIKIYCTFQAQVIVLF